MVIFYIFALVNPEKQWLLLEWCLESVHDLDLLLFVVVFQDFVFLGKENRISLLTNWIVFEYEVHADTVKQLVLMKFDRELFHIDVKFICNAVSIRTF